MGVVRNLRGVARSRAGADSSVRASEPGRVGEARGAVAPHTPGAAFKLQVQPAGQSCARGVDGSAGRCGEEDPGVGGGDVLEDFAGPGDDNPAPGSDVRA